MSMLPTEKTPPVSDLSKLIMFLYGEVKIGKSTLASKFPNAVFLATEPGLNSLDVYEVSIKTWGDMLNTCKELASGNHAFQTIVIDTGDNLYKMCEAHVCEQHGVIHQSDLDWGKGWALVNNEFRRVLTKLGQMPMGLIITSHAIDREVETPTAKYNKTVPTMSKGARDVILGMADFVLFATAETDEDGTTRVLKTKPNKYYEAGDRTGRLPESIPLDYAAFITAWDDANKPKHPTPVNVHTTEETEETTDNE